MKKIVVLLCTLLMCCLVGCGAKGKSPVTVTPQRAETEENMTEEEKEVKPSEEVKEKEEKTQENKEASYFLKSKPSIEETILVDQDGIKLIANSLEYESSGVVLNVTIENNSEEDLSFFSGTALYSMNTINKCISDGYLNCDVAAGMKAKDEIYFREDAFSLNGIDDIGEIGLAIYVENSDYDEVFRSGLLTIPTSEYSKVDYSEDTIKKAIDKNWEKDLGMDLLYSNTDFSTTLENVNISAVVIANRSKDSSDNYIFLEMENTSDHDVRFTSANININGITVCAGNWDSFCIPYGGRSLVYFGLDSLIDEEYESILDQNKIGIFSFDLIERDFNTYDEIATSNVTIAFDEKLADTDVPETKIYESDTVNIYQMPLAEDEYLYYIIPLLVENVSDKEISLHTEYDSLAIDGYMADFSSYSCNVAAGGKSVLSIKVNKDSVEEIGINGLSDFTTGVCKVELKDENYHTIDNLSLEMNFQ